MKTTMDLMKKYETMCKQCRQTGMLPWYLAVLSK